MHKPTLAGASALAAAPVFALIGIAVAVKAGAARWMAVVIAIGAFGGGAGFAAASKPLLLISFVILLVGLTGACAALVTGPARGSRPVYPDEMAVPAG